jgi:extracellular factor (EF) 3-hydroxypalmitic acid methyl ester biosynthesis protein
VIEHQYSESVQTRLPVCDAVRQTAHTFVFELQSIDRRARREARTLPTQQEAATMRTIFWGGLIPAIADAEFALAPDAQDQLALKVRSMLAPWLLRSKYWNRSLVKPHGYAGDYRMVELMYDLETASAADPCAPAVVNVLDSLFRSVHSVHAVWHRRAWFAGLIEAALTDVDRPLRVLDVACGGSRYVRDVIDRRGPTAVHATFLDQDPAAVAHVASWLPTPAHPHARLLCAPIRDLPASIPVAADPADGFDVVIATGVFDYLPDDTARGLLDHMCGLTRPGGAVAICNFAPADRSRLVKSWLVDWPLIYRTDVELAALFGVCADPRVTASPDGGLLYAHALAAAREN